MILLVAAVGWLIRYQSYGKYQQTTDDAFVHTDAIIIAPKVSGYVDRLYVADNQQVKAGQPLLRIDPRDYSAQASQSQAQIDLARASAQGADAQIAEQRAAIDRAQADLTAARASADFAAAEVARYRPLAATGAETRERLSTLQNEDAQARAKVAAASAALTSARRRIATLKSQAGEALAKIEAARAQFAAAHTNVEATVLRAGATGRIGNKTVQQGQFVQPATRLMTLVPDSSLFVEANFKETQLSLMRVGQPVRLEVDALPGVEIRGHVASFSPGTGAQFSILPPQNATGNFTKIVQRVAVRIAIDASPEARRLLIPGMSVEASVDTRSAKGAEARIREDQERHNARTGG
jgi:membrane fusion protein (multidrug efflux system)